MCSSTLLAAMQESVPLEISTALELARHHKAEMESKMTQLQVDMLKFTGIVWVLTLQYT